MTHPETPAGTAPGDGRATRERAYAERLARLEGTWWKRWLNVQAPYRAHVRGLRLGLVLDIGCGIGRNLSHLDGQAVGIDHSAHAVERARARGFSAYTPEAFAASDWNTPRRFDALLLAHVVEHLAYAESAALLARYLPCVRPGGRVVLIAPQEAGYASDATHVEPYDLDRLTALAEGAGLTVERRYSFPFPRIVGRLFRYNESVVLATVR